MRLSIQSFQRKFDPNKETAKAELNEFSNMLITQIDTMSTIASAFSDFAKMPSQNKERINITENIKHTIDLFGKPYISYFYEETIVYANVDKTQLTRVVTNLIKNASQALEEQENPKIEVNLIAKEAVFIIKIADNGIGIPEHLKDKIFEPKFTTKSSGMGLGLPMIKKIIESYKGTISYTSTVGRGTVFTVTIPKK
jgi:nitrogen fixation/metabolism regulation signal transduction histidine kinase